jgi:hypothetical protein
MERMKMEGLAKHIRKAMAEDLEEAGLLTPVLDPDHVIHQVTEVLGKQFEKRIAIVWSVEDVLTMAHLKSEFTDGKEWMTNEEAAEVLGEMQHRHDASIGINHDVIYAYCFDFKQQLGGEEINKRQGDTDES